MSRSYIRSVQRALGSKEDVWGDSLLRSSTGPTYEGVRRHLQPLLVFNHPLGARSSLSGLYYLPFAEPAGAEGASSVALHLADGSEIAADRLDGRRLTIGVGGRGAEPYGSCLARATPARLFGGYLPILDTSYVDAAGVRYQQESFAARIPQTRSLVSFLRLQVDARGAAGTAAREVRFTTSGSDLVPAPGRLIRGHDTFLVFSNGGEAAGRSVVYPIRQPEQTIYVAWLDQPAALGTFELGQSTYDGARSSLIGYWTERLSEGATFIVPDRRVLDAERNLLIQNLEMTWRYSIGNAYQEFEFPESIDGAAVMGDYGFQAVNRAILRMALDQELVIYPNWDRGEELLGSALYYRLFRDGPFIAQTTPILARYVRSLAHQLAATRRSLLPRERYASDLPSAVYALDSQAIVWEGLRAMAAVWEQSGYRGLAQEARRLATRLGAGLHAAVRSSSRRLRDGSLFIPIKLGDHESAYNALTSSSAGSYWNLVIPYALASGLFSPGGDQATAALRYLLQHGSRLLGLVRFSLTGRDGYAVSPIGTDEVYGLDVARFLADNDQPGQLGLSLYGQLGAAMTPDTFVSGESATIPSARRSFYRQMYLPPNSVSNATFLETLRLMLIHETRAQSGDPLGLELAYATPRSWLKPGQQIIVDNAPTSFGRLSFAIEATKDSVRATINVPTTTRPRTLKLRLRLPPGTRIVAVSLAGRRYGRVDLNTETVDLSGLRGALTLEAQVRTR
ncbi:MAG TPA: hypothetical protein VF002_06535 [Gaiellaceae bacterium]